MTRLLFASSEAHPLIKTGGLGDVSGTLPITLQQLGDDVRLVLPAYRQVLAQLPGAHTVATLHLVGVPTPVHVRESRLPGSEVVLWLVDAPAAFDRDGGPYQGPDGRDWADNADRFALFARAVVELAQDRAGLGWRAEVVHCNDWQTGLVPALLSREPQRPGTVFTIHNLAYQGLFPAETVGALHLPADLWHMHGLEFHGLLSFIKGGLAYADWVTTVSPTYAEEIRTAQFGYGLEGLLSYRAARLRGILNGVDYATWDPRHDGFIPHRYTPAKPTGKRRDKQALQQQFGLPEQAETPLIGLVGRLVEQKGIDLVLAAAARLLQHDLQLVVVGTGEKHYEQAWRELAERHPERIGILIGYDEARAHLVEAGADMFLMPSRFEPCGLNQIFSLRYGTLPIVRHTGGLADTVVHADAAAIAAGTATGFVFDDPNPEAVLWAVEQALELYRHPRKWRQVMLSAMAQDYGWEQSARQYQELYRQPA